MFELEHKNMANLSQLKQVSGKELEEISTFVSNAMFVSMASHSKTRALRNEFLTLELLYFLRKKLLMRRYFGGSVAEGTELSDSDIDKMIVFSNISVTFESDISLNTRDIVFVTDTSNCQPGYTRLAPLCLNSDNYTIFYDNGSTLNSMLDNQYDEKDYLSSDKIVEFWVKFLSQTNRAALTPEYRHGPAATTITEMVRGYTINESSGQIEHDFVYGIPLNSWPPNADSWVKRERKYEWPSKELIDKVKNLKCHVVAVGDKSSTSSSIEWRFSYLLQERELVWNFSDVQLQCYVLLKKVLRIFIAPVAQDDVSSYHMKTIMFWEVENRSGESWKPCHLLKRLKNCLLVLKQCVTQGYIEHYIDGRNLFYRKLQDVVVKQEIIKGIDTSLDDLVQTVLSCVDEGKYLPNWIDSSKTTERLLRLCQEREVAYITDGFVELRPSFEVINKYHGVFGVLVELVYANFKTLSLYHQSYIPEQINKDIDTYFNDLVLKLLRIRIVITLIKKDEVPKMDIEEKIQKLRIFLEENIDIDGLSGKLYLVTFLLKTQCGNAVHMMIHDILHKEANLFYIGKCSTLKSLHISNGYVTQRRGFPPPFKSYPGPQFVAFDVMFSKDDSTFVPYAVKFECLMENGCFLHPVVYMMYAKFLSCGDSTSSAQALVDLETFICGCDGSLYNHKQINILGHCFFLKGHFVKAFDCFSKSLKETAPTYRPNAAVFHLIIMILHLHSEIIYERL